MKALQKWKNKIEKLKGKFSQQNLCRLAIHMVFYLTSQKEKVLIKNLSNYSLVYEDIKNRQQTYLSRSLTWSNVSKTTLNCLCSVCPAFCFEPIDLKFKLRHIWFQWQLNKLLIRRTLEKYLMLFPSAFTFWSARWKKITCDWQLSED